MEELELLKRQIETATELQSLVRVMKSLAASRVREYDQAVASIEEFGRTVASGLQVAMRNRPREITVHTPRSNRIGAIILGSDQGLCGNFNERIADHAVATMSELGISTKSQAIVVVGERPAMYLEAAGYTLEDHLPFTGDHSAVTRVILRVLEKVEEWDSRERMERIALFYNKPAEGATFQPEMQYLLPLDTAWLQALGEQKWPGRSIPTFSMKWDSLFAGLVKQHIFFTIYRAFIESMASENTSRLRAMQAAQENIDQRLDELHSGYNRMRQSSVTSELLDISTGFMAITEQDANSSRTG